MSNAEPNNIFKRNNVIELPLSAEQKFLYTQSIADAQKRGGKGCLVIFRANEKLYGLYGTGIKVAGTLRGLSPRTDFKTLGFEELANVYQNQKLRALSHEAAKELVKEKSKEYSSEPVNLFFADEEGPENLYGDEPVQTGEDT